MVWSGTYLMESKKKKMEFSAVTEAVVERRILKLQFSTVIVSPSICQTLFLTSVYGGEGALVVGGSTAL